MHRSSKTQRVERSQIHTTTCISHLLCIMVMGQLSHEHELDSSVTKKILGAKPRNQDACITFSLEVAHNVATSGLNRRAIMCRAYASAPQVAKGERFYDK